MSRVGLAVRATFRMLSGKSALLLALVWSVLLFLCSAKWPGC